MITDFLGYVKLGAHTAPAPERIANAIAALSGRPISRATYEGQRHWLTATTAASESGLDDGGVWQAGSNTAAVVSGRIDSIKSASAQACEKSAARTLLGLYRDRGCAGFGDIEGRFSAAIWDSASNSLIAVRDAIGHEPFYYIHQPQYFAYSTSFKALRASLGGKETPDPLGIADYLALTHSDIQRTLLTEIRRLPPAHSLVLSADGTLKVQRYWSLRQCRTGMYSSADECYAAFRQAVVEAVGAECRQSRQAGLMLSGGLDSSSIGAAFFNGGGASNASLYAFGSRVSQVLEAAAAEDETPFMEAFVERYPRTLLEVKEVATSLLDGIPDTVASIGFPHRDVYFSEPLAMALRAREAGCDVLLSGMGGDFFASSKFHAYYAYQFFDGHWLAAIRQARVENQSMTARRWSKLLGGQVIRPALRPLWRKILSEVSPQRLGWPSAHPLPLQKTFAKQTAFHRRAAGMARSLIANPLLGTAADADARMLESGLIAHTLEYQAALSRSLGLRIANPLLDRRVVVAAATMPVNYRRWGLGQRSPIRQAFASLLPPLIATRVSKGNFIDYTLKQNPDEAVKRCLRQLAAEPKLAPYLDLSPLLKALNAPVEAASDDRMELLILSYLAASLNAFLKL